MNTKDAGKGPRRDGEKERLWRGRLKEFVQSGESIRAFCRSRDIPEPQFYSWRREIRRRDQEKEKSAPLLAPVAIVGDLPSSAEPIELVLDDVTLRVPATATREGLATILDVLESRRC